MGLQDQLARRHAADALEPDQRVAHVVEDAGAEHEVEGPDRLRVELVHVHAAVLDLAVEVLVRRQEAVEPAMVPRVGVDRQDALGAAAFELEREEAVPGADVEHGLARQIVGNPQQAQAPAKSPPHVCGPRDDAVEVERGIEAAAQVLQALPQLLSVGHEEAYPSREGRERSAWIMRA